MKVISYNINGIRAALRKGLDQWIKAAQADILCFQEIKANESQFDVQIFEDLGYHTYWFPAQKLGYSGTAILSKIKPQSITYGMGHDLYDYEGRVLKADFDDFSVVNVYMPSGSSGEIRQAFKYQFLDDFYNYTQRVLNTHPNLIVCGDYNICHQPIDIHNPLRNKNTSGFLPQEREWLTSFLALGFVDTFRNFCDEPHHYSWWSYRANARVKNLGWRIDYLLASLPLQKHLSSAQILSQAKHSDHCPVVLSLDV